MIEAVAFVERFAFFFHIVSQAVRCQFIERSREHNRLSFLDWHLEITWHEEVFRSVVAAFAFLRVVESAIPIGAIVEFRFDVSLHEEVGITLIEAHFYTILHLCVSAVGNRVFVCPLAHTSEGQERFQAQRGGRMSIEQRVADIKLIIVGAECHFLFEQHATDTINPGRHLVPLKAHDILVSLRTVIFPLVFMKAEVELRAVLNDSFVKRGEQHMVFVVQFGNRNDHEAVVLTDIAANQCCVTVSARAVCDQKFLIEGVLKVRHLRFVKF